MNRGRHALASPGGDLSLADFLRGQLGLCGTKVGCGEGGCGACTVAVARLQPGGGGQIHHRAVNSCITKVSANVSCL